MERLLLTFFFQPTFMRAVRPTKLTPGLADRTRKPQPTGEFYQYTYANASIWLAELLYISITQQVD